MRRIMKYLQLIFIFILVITVNPVHGASLTFQNIGDITNIKCIPYGGPGGTCGWNQSYSGGNSYAYSKSNVGYAIVSGNDGTPSSYFAWTVLDAGSDNVVAMDSSYNVIANWVPYLNPEDRVEIKVIGGAASCYVNGIRFGTVQSVALNPTYAGSFSSGFTYIDRIVTGATENRYIFGSPEDGYYLQKDLINPAASGLYHQNGTLISSYNMSTEWAIGDTNTTKTIQLKEWSSGYISATNITKNGTMSGIIRWPLTDAIFNNPNSAYGFYVTTIDGSGIVSETIPYIANGASVAFDQASYSVGSTATITYAISSGGYWDTATYTYKMNVINIYGAVKSTQPITAQSGSTTVTFSDDDVLGVYYAVLMATPRAGGNDIWMNYDAAELNNYVIFTGYVNNAETATAINGANVSIWQGTTFYNKTTIIDGNYTSDAAFYSGSITNILVTATGFQNYANSFTPLRGGTINLNFTLLSSTPTTSGTTTGGVTRDTVYGNPIPSATIDALNTSFGESKTTSTNNAGYYVFINANGLTSGRCYNITGSKIKYSTESYFKCVGT